MAPPPAPAIGVAPFYVGPADFDGATTTIDLPVPPRGTSLLLVVPDLGMQAYRRGWDLGQRQVLVRVSVETSAPGAQPTAGHPLPARTRLAPVASAPPAAPADVMQPPTRAFKVHARDTKSYLDATGRLAYVGARYVFYEDTTNRKNFTRDEYARIDAAARESYDKLVDIFGEPPDLDGNGRVIAFVSRTVAEHRKDAQGGVDGCNLDPGSAQCGGKGEIVYLWSLDGFPDADARRDFYAQDYYPRTLLHETIHLCQLRAALDRHVPVYSVGVPAYLHEGQAMLMRYVGGGGSVDWGELSRLVDHLGPRGTPFDSPYALGGLLLWWMHQHYGPSVQRALIDAELDREAADPVEKATGAPEPLMLVQFYAALHLDGTAYGRESGLEFDAEHVRSRIPRVPVEPVREGESREATTFATGHAAFEVEHRGPVRVRIEAVLEPAYVLVVQLR